MIYIFIDYMRPDKVGSYSNQLQKKNYDFDFTD